MGIITYINETKAEMNHVNWPTRGQALLYTLLVVIFSVAIAAYLGFFDAIFAAGITQIIAK